MHFGVSHYEKQHKEGTYKVLRRSVVFSAFYADFCFCSKLVIITTLKRHIKFAADDILIFYFYLSKKIRLDFFMWILCLAEDSRETSSLIFHEKQ